MAGTNRDDDMSSNVRNARSRLLRGKGDIIDRGLLAGGYPRRSRGEKLSVDSYRARLRGTIGLLGREVVVELRKTVFSSHKATLVAKNKANYCWWDFCIFFPMTTVVVPT